jgi:hypothetical protein
MAVAAVAVAKARLGLVVLAVVEGVMFKTIILHLLVLQIQAAVAAVTVVFMALKAGHIPKQVVLAL